ncbi:MAG: LysR family transcriptional regulator [Fibrobacter sp.]|nr:LysR family transcriptional regulator [Fibrobacter sp.]
MFVETYILRLLAGFLEYGTLSAVADKLYTSQPAVSRAFKKLEDEIGAPLFERKKNRIELNEKGRTVAEYAKRIMDLQGEMMEKVSPQGATRTFSIASVAILPAMRMVQELQEKYPGAQVTYEIIDNEAGVLKALNEGSADIGITLKAPHAKKYRAEKYMQERLSIALPKKHPLANRKSIRLRELKGETIIQRSNVGFWEQVKRKKIPDVTFIKHDSTKGISKLIEQSSLLTFVSDQKFDYEIPKDRKIVPLADREMNVEFFKVTLASTP